MKESTGEPVAPETWLDVKYRNDPQSIDADIEELEKKVKQLGRLMGDVINTDGDAYDRIKVQFDTAEAELSQLKIRKREMEKSGKLSLNNEKE